MTVREIIGFIMFVLGMAGIESEFVLTPAALFVIGMCLLAKSALRRVKKSVCLDWIEDTYYDDSLKRIRKRR